MTSEFMVTPSGLMYPHKKEPEKQEVVFRTPLELEDEELRQKAKDGLLLLWDAMSLSEPGSLFDGKKKYATYRAAYDLLGTMLLGDGGYPVKEQYC